MFHQHIQSTNRQAVIICQVALYSGAQGCQAGRGSFVGEWAETLACTQATTEGRIAVSTASAQSRSNPTLLRNIT